MSTPTRDITGRLMKVSEYLTIRVNFNRSLQVEKVKDLGLIPCFRIGKGLYYIHNGLTDESGNVLNLKYVLIRPDINYCDAGVFDYIPGQNLKEVIADNYFSHNFNEF